MTRYEYEIRLERIRVNGDLWYIVYKREPTWFSKGKWTYDTLFGTEERARDYINRETTPVKSTIIARFDSLGNELKGKIL